MDFLNMPPNGGCLPLERRPPSVYIAGPLVGWGVLVRFVAGSWGSPWIWIVGVGVVMLGGLPFLLVVLLDRLRDPLFGGGLWVRL